MLQTILYGNFVPPDVPSRKIMMDDRAHRVAIMPVSKRRGAARSAVAAALKRQPSEWMSIAMVAADAGCCDDTAQKILNHMASEHKILKRYALTGKRGAKSAVFKWIVKHAKK